MKKTARPPKKIPELLLPFIISVICLLVKLFRVKLGISLPPSEFTLYAAMAAWMWYARNHIRRRFLSKPLQLVSYTGLTAFLVHLLFLFSHFLVEPQKTGVEDFSGSILSASFFFLILMAVVFILSGLRELFFLGQKRNPAFFFYVMLAFFTVVFFYSGFKTISFSRAAILVPAFFFSFINSLRVAWLTFLTRREKVTLMVLAAVFAMVFAYNLTLENNTLMKMLPLFSPGLTTAIRLIMLYGMVYMGMVFLVTLFHLPTADAIDRKTVEAASLKDLTHLFTRVFDFDKLADTVTAITAKVCHSNSAWLVTREETGFQLKSAHKIEPKKAAKISRLLLDGEAISAKRASTLTQKTIKALLKGRVSIKGLKAITAAPLRVQDNTKGFLFAGCSKVGGFDKEDEQTAAVFADYAAVALENAGLLKERLEKERMEKELEVARSIQQKLLPLQPPQFDRLSSAAYFSPAFEAGGDYYDFFQLAPGRLGFVMADVSGKGISAAFIMAEVKGIFESLAKTVAAPRELLLAANNILTGSIEKERFVTAVYGIFDLESGKLRFSRAGHPPLLCRSGVKVRRLQPRGIALGMLAEEKFSRKLEEVEIPLQPGDVVVVYTDGIDEARNIQDEDFGYERLQEIVQSHGDRSARELIDKIIEEVTVFSQGSSQHDDITLLVFKRDS